MSEYKKILKEMQPTSIITNNLDKIWENYQISVFEIADSVFKQVIKPFCQKRKINFLSGNGEWHMEINNKFYTSVDIELDLSSDSELQEIRIMLNTEIPGMSRDCLGSLMENYNSKYQPIHDYLDKKK